MIRRKSQNKGDKIAEPNLKLLAPQHRPGLISLSELDRVTPQR